MAEFWRRKRWSIRCEVSKPHLANSLQDLWSINLDKMDQWNCILKDSIDLTHWKGDSDSESSDSYESYESENDSGEQELAESRKRKAAALEKRIQDARQKRDDSIMTHPEPNESLGDFYSRTVGYWQNRMLNGDDDDVYVPESMSQADPKTKRRNAFRMAQACHESWQEKLRELESQVDQELE